MATTHNHSQEHSHAHPHAPVAAQMAEVASQFLDSLTADQRAKTIYHFLDGERIFWYYPPLNRHGLPLRDMDQRQRELAYKLMEVSLEKSSYEKAKQIIEHELILGPIEKEEGQVSFDRNLELYYWTIFGDPNNSSMPWGWRAEGHHVSLHINAWGDEVISTTPFFFGANPAEVKKGPQQGLRILGRREDLAVELAQSLDAGHRSRAIIHDKAPWDILTYNSSKAAIHDEEGLAARDMSGTQKEILLNLIAEYVNQVHPTVAQQKMDFIKKEGLDHFRLVWAGATDRSRDHYYRIHGGKFIVEFDNIQNGANHIHSVVRDVDNDFGEDVMRKHRLMYHVL